MGFCAEADSFFKKTNIHILQCDERVQSDRKITSAEELKEYMEQLELYGRGDGFSSGFCVCKFDVGKP